MRYVKHTCTCIVLMLLFCKPHVLVVLVFFLEQRILVYISVDYVQCIGFEMHVLYSQDHACSKQCTLPLLDSMISPEPCTCFVYLTKYFSLFRAELSEII